MRVPAGMLAVGAGTHVQGMSEMMMQSNRMVEAACFCYFMELGIRVAQHDSCFTEADTRQHSMRGLPDVLFEGLEECGA